MIHNIDTKAKIKNLQEKEQLVKEIGEFQYEETQVDTYFKVKKGKLKIRESPHEASLILYDRPTKKIRETNILIFGATFNPASAKSLTTGEITNLKNILMKVLDVKVIITKKRKIYFTKSLSIPGELRIHIDNVNDLGKFIEFEIQTTEKKEGKKLIRNLLERCKISEDALIEDSYSDLLKKRKFTTNSSSKTRETM